MLEADKSAKREFVQILDEILNGAVSYTANLKGKRRDEAIFDYLCGACAALYATGEINSDCPPFLFVIGVRAGDRLKEIERMLNAAPKP